MLSPIWQMHSKTKAQIQHVIVSLPDEYQAACYDINVW